MNLIAEGTESTDVPPPYIVSIIYELHNPPGGIRFVPSEFRPPSTRKRKRHHGQGGNASSMELSGSRNDQVSMHLKNMYWYLSFKTENYTFSCTDIYR